MLGGENVLPQNELVKESIVNVVSFHFFYSEECVLEVHYSVGQAHGI